MFWASALLVHLCAVPSILRHFSIAFVEGEYAAPALRALLLILSAAFFVLKILDLPALRFRGGPRSLFCAGLIVALLHLGILERSQESQNPLLPVRAGVVLFATGASGWALSAERRPSGELRDRVRGILQVLRLQTRRACFDWIHHAVSRRASAWVFLNVHGLRAPPAI
ncbi:MAG: hypothetical protein IT449_16955 [Phycisphaerales bacterium]|nr:hypothetical protein [Phycisphaerales bacterium]